VVLTLRDPDEWYASAVLGSLAVAAAGRDDRLRVEAGVAAEQRVCAARQTDSSWFDETTW
jgi:hypothetical protein